MCKPKEKEVTGVCVKVHLDSLLHRHTLHFIPFTKNTRKENATGILLKCYLHLSHSSNTKTRSQVRHVTLSPLER